MGRYSRKDMIEFANFAKSYQSSKKVEEAYVAYLKGARIKPKKPKLLHGKCDFCNVREAIGVFCTHMPISLGYCQQCLDAKQIRTIHNVNVNWVRTGDKYFEKNDCTVFFNGEYLPIKKYSETVTEEDVKEYYKDLTVWTQLVEQLINRINERRIR